MSKLSDKARIYARTYTESPLGREIMGTAELLLQMADEIEKHEKRRSIRMGKSVLIIDTPADCRDCTVRSLADDCLATGRHVKGYRENKCRPEWCPLEEVKESSIKRCISHLERHGYIALEFHGVSKKDTQKDTKCSCSVCLVQ